MRAETSGPLAVATILLLVPTLAGCLSGRTATAPEPAPLRIGDWFNYTLDVTLHNRTAKRVLEFTGRSEITAPGLDGPCVWMNTTGKAIDPNVSYPTCLAPGPLGRRAEKLGIINLGINHSGWRYRDSLEFWNGIFLPTAGVVFGADERGYVVEIPQPAFPAETLNVSWTVDGDRAVLDGHLTFQEPRTPATRDKPARRVNWTATYRADVPLPVRVDIAACGGLGWDTGNMVLSELGRDDSGDLDRFPCPPRVGTWELVDHRPGNGSVIEQTMPDRAAWPGEPAPRSDSAGNGSRSWTEVLDPGEPHAGYDLDRAWRFAKMRDPELRAFLVNGSDPTGSVTFPAGVTYDRINATDGSIYHIWRVALCKADGACYMAISGVRRLANGTGYPFIEFRDRYVPPATHGRWWHGPFEGYPLPASVKEETLASAMPMRETLEGWERLQPVEMSVRGFYAQLVPGSYPGEAGPLWDFAAGVVHGELWFDPQTEDARDGSLALRHVYSHLDGVTGEPLLLEVPLEPLPAWWHHHEPSFVEDAGPGVAAPRCPAGERRDDPTVIEAFSPGEALLVERLVGERCSGSMVKGPLLE